MINRQGYTGNRTDSPDFLKVLLTLKDNIMKDINVGEVCKVIEYRNNQYSVVSINNADLRLRCYKLASVDVEVGDIVLVIFNNCDYKLNLNKINNNLAVQNLSDNILHSTNYGIITGSFSRSSGSGIIVDNELSNTSINPVQNKVIAQAIIDLQNEKVDKVTGKQLSTEDFTPAEKAKLDGLNNYDDTQVRADITNINASLTSIVAQLNSLENSYQLINTISVVDQWKAEIPVDLSMYDYYLSMTLSKSGGTANISVRYAHDDTILDMADRWSYVGVVKTTSGSGSGAVAGYCHATETGGYAYLLDMENNANRYADINVIMYNDNTTQDSIRYQSIGSRNYASNWQMRLSSGVIYGASQTINKFVVTNAELSQNELLNGNIRVYRRLKYGETR